ncbi:MAG: DsrE family protein [Gammaproteobacteria bacterium]|nr:DsrE family protein [Gammaproteobacteria bacterium]
MKKSLFTLLIVTFITGLNLGVVSAGDEDDVRSILQMQEAPEGVVFEIIASRDGLTWAIPRVKKFSEQLRQRFPDLSIAVVSHGSEQFALQKRYQDDYSNVHQQVKSLVADNDIPVHVCGTYAEWKGVTPEEFADYVDVAAEGPAQIRNYEELGFIRVVLDDPV